MNQIPFYDMETPETQPAADEGLSDTVSRKELLDLISREIPTWQRVRYLIQTHALGRGELTTWYSPGMQPELVFVRTEKDEEIERLRASEASLKEKLESTESDLEQCRVQLAGCGASALGYGMGCKKGDYGWSGSFDDVERLYRTKEDYRHQLTALQAANANLRNKAIEIIDEFIERERSGLKNMQVLGVLHSVRRELAELEAAGEKEGAP